MFRKVLLTIGLLLAAQVAAMAQGTIKGAITDEKNGDPLIGANVVLKLDGQIVTGARTDFNGDYTIKGVQVGKYDIEVSYMGYTTVKSEINVKATGFTVYNEKLGKSAGGEQLKTVVVKANKVPVIDIGAPESGTRLSSDDIGKMPANSVDGIVAAVAGVGYNDGGTGTARGEEGMVTQVGNVRARTGVNVPKEAIAEIQVVLGGTPANIGEAIGGTQIITLKPPSSKFQGSVRYDTYLDYRLYNQLNVYLTGPVAKKALKDEQGNKTGERTFIGFRFTGTGSFSKFGYRRPRDGRYQVVNDEKVMEMEQNPLVYDPVEGTVNYAAEYLRKEDFVEIKRPNARNYYASDDRSADFKSYSIALQGALDFRFSELTSLILTGEYDYSYGPNTSILYFPLGLHNAANGVSRTNNFVITADFTQRFKDPEPVSDPSNPDAKVDPAVSKVMYNITAMYNRYSRDYFNEQFGDNIFRYGHIGQFYRTQTPNWEINTSYDYHGTTQTAHVQNSWLETVESFTPSEYNPILANYTAQLYNTPQISPYLANFETIRAFQGLINGTSPSNVYDLFYNVGVQNTTYAKQLNNYYYVSAKAAATVKGHDLEFGFQYDQYTQSYYGLDAYRLWTLMRQSANAHITQLDYSQPIEYYVGSDLYVDYNRKVGGGQTLFDQTLREKLGLDVNGTDWLDIDRYTPDEYNDFGGISMFSANELFNSGNNPLVSYYGYDHTGEKYRAGSSWDLEDFFDPKGRGHENYQYLPSFKPIYAAGYIQDKFFFQDLIFNVGVRVDYYDGNQMVLKDPYLLYESYDVKALKDGRANYNGQLYAGAGDDWVVYVDDPNLTTPTIRGYRDGSIWYNADGVQVSTPNDISGESGKPTPYRTKGTDGGQQTYTTGNTSGNRISSKAFKDYDPQVVVMPRIAFSFPVNDMSQFKANYDIIARRPSSGWQADYTSYLFMPLQTDPINNPNLKPERITNYELGFQQALNKDKTAAISISAYYKETRDLIQLVQYAGADPNNNYYSYDNLDFKTTKGFSLSFDMRQSSHVRINANYTLQYAEETGLSRATMTELIKEGYTTLKMLNPIADDRRHEFKANLDYRLAKGEGPKITRTVKDKDGNLRKKDIFPLQNFGVNFVAVAQSGRPYTRQYSNMQSTIVGSYRGARLPWAFFFDVIVDKSWPIEIKHEGKKPRQTMLTAAVVVQNLFDIRNTAGVYAVTGSPTDDGYLTDPETQSTINSYIDPQSFRDLYTISLSNRNWMYSTPRTVYLQVSYKF